jgi:ankyrin repeat protein
MSSTEHSTSTDFASIDQFEAARTGNLAWFQHHKAAGTLPKLNLCDDDSGWFLLDLAARYGHLSVVRYLIEDSGHSIDATAHNNFALRYAACNGHLPVVRYLIEESGQLVDATSHDNRVLRYAAANGHLSVVRYLIEESGQSVDATADDNYALQLAAANGHLLVVRYLIEESNQPVDVFANDNKLLRTAADTSSFVELRTYLETVIPIIESLGLDLAREFFTSQLSESTKNTTLSSMKGRI